VRKWLGLLVVIALWGAAPAGAEGSRLAVALDFSALAQGTAGLVTVEGDGLAGVRARFLSRLIDCYERDGVWHCLLAVNMEQQPKPYPLELYGWFDDGTRETWTGDVTVTATEFIRQDVTLTNDLGYLLEPEVDRAERARLSSIFSRVTPVHYWNGPFARPLEAEFTSPFGAWRLYNEALWGRHTGADLRGPAGTPLLAPAAGRVVLAERLDVRGGYVLIDHGLGVYSGLAHLSEIHVTRGQYVRQGQVIGISGSTGRSSGPHIHWEMAVNGEWIDPAQFLELNVP